jgi:hypothetical protein
MFALERIARTKVRHRVMSEKCHEQTHAVQYMISLFNHVIGGGEHR